MKNGQKDHLCILHLLKKKFLQDSFFDSFRFEIGGFSHLGKRRKKKRKNEEKKRKKILFSRKVWYGKEMFVIQQRNTKRIFSIK